MELQVAAICGAAAHNISTALCNPVFADRSGMASSRLRGAAAVCVTLLSLAAGHRKSYWNGYIKVALSCVMTFLKFGAGNFPFKLARFKKAVVSNHSRTSTYGTMRCFDRYGTWYSTMVRVFFQVRYGGAVRWYGRWYGGTVHWYTTVPDQTRSRQR